LTLEFARLCVWGCRLWSPGSQVLFRLYLACRRCCGCVLQVFYCARHGSREPASMWKLVPAVLQNPLQATPQRDLVLVLMESQLYWWSIFERYYTENDGYQIICLQVQLVTGLATKLS
jgi:hypothetical protein